MGVNSESSTMLCFGPRKTAAKPVVWILPVVFILVSAFFFILWKRAYSDPVNINYTIRKDQSKMGGNTTISPITLANNNNDIPIIFGITPTYKRSTQKVDLTSLCHTVSLVPKFVWIVVEDSTEKTGLVSRLLQRCKVESIHMNVRTPPKQRSRGVMQRNAGLDWVRSHCKEAKCDGVVYFMDDDNRYDLRLFDEMRKTKGVSVFPVAFTGGLAVEGPMCEDGKVVKWIVTYAPQRSIPIDMAGFAINVRLLLEKPEAVIGRKKDGGTVVPGYLEPEFVGQFATRETVECRGPKEVLVWHTKTQARIHDDNGAAAGYEVR